ncbi:hypothetical protein GCM10023187_45660 [Nibrella viscosa]|uniref:Uncharacterized protein n=1 Tax=Nibrella viscosa TaxID=1084524 RepID=A0ABP8KUG8_9BACT
MGAIRAGKDPKEFTKRIRGIKLIPHPWGEGVVNTHLVKHWEPPHSDSAWKYPPTHLSSTVVYREFVYFEGGVDIYLPDDTESWLVPILPFINSFGKQGGFFSFHSFEQAEPPKPTTHLVASDMKPNATWEKVSNFSGESKKPRDTDAWLSFRAELVSAGSTYKYYRFDEL